MKTSIAARLQIHGKPPHEGYWQRLSISVEVLNQREGAQREREGGGCGERHRKKGKQGGGGGVESGENRWFNLLNLTSQVLGC